MSRLSILLLSQADAYISREAVTLKKKKKSSRNNFVLAPVALGDGMTVPIIGVFLFLDPSNVSLGFQKVCIFFFLFPFFFADCHPPASVNGTRHVPLGHSEPSRLASHAELLNAGTEPKDTPKKKSRNQLYLEQEGRRAWASPLGEIFLLSSA